MKLAAAILLVGLSAADGAHASEEGTGIFFGGAAGGGVAWVDHPGLSGDARPGGYVALQFGWNLSPRFSVGGEFTTWGTSPLGTPVHLHALGPRVEFAPHARAGLFVAGTVGLALTEGEVNARAGGAGVLSGGYRWGLSQWTTLAFELGAHGHLYSDGSAMFPVAALQLRFHGDQGR